MDNAIVTKAADLVAKSLGEELTVEEWRIIGSALLEGREGNPSDANFKLWKDENGFGKLTSKATQQAMWIATDEGWEMYQTYPETARRKIYKAMAYQRQQRLEQEGPNVTMTDLVKANWGVGEVLSPSDVLERIGLDPIHKESVRRVMRSMTELSQATRSKRGHFARVDGEPQPKPKTDGRARARALDEVANMILNGQADQLLTADMPFEEGRSDMRMIRIDGGTTWAEGLKEPAVEDWTTVEPGGLYGYTEAYEARVVVRKVRLKITRPETGASGFKKEVVGDAT